MNAKLYYEDLIDEIIGMIKDNLILQFKYNDDALISMKDFCIENKEKEYKPINYKQLLFFTEEALTELINCPDLYDFRSL